MRFSRSMASATLAAALVLAAPLATAAHARGDAENALSGAECRTRVDGSHVTAYCHNPYPETDRLRLHIECARWWDLDSDGRATDARPATTVRLAGRCWKEVRAAWVSHQHRGS